MSGSQMWIKKHTEHYTIHVNLTTELYLHVEPAILVFLFSIPFHHKTEI